MTSASPTALLGRILDSEAGRRQAWAVLWRVSVWQCWRRVLRRPMRFRSITGSRLHLLPGASDSLSGFWYQSLPDFEELAFALHLVQPGDLFVDVGANQGGWSLVLAGRGARVIACEPIPETFARLQGNIAANPPAIRERITPVSIGLGERAMTVRFTAGLDAANHRLRNDAAAAAATTIQLLPADDVLATENPVLIKIDVEGEELSVLQGAVSTLAKPSLRAVVMETFRPQNHAQDFLRMAEALLAAQGFEPVTYEPWRRELRRLERPEDGGQNTIYVRGVEETNARLRRASAIRIFGGEL